VKRPGKRPARRRISIAGKPLQLSLALAGLSHTK